MGGEVTVNTNDPHIGMGEWAALKLKGTAHWLIDKGIRESGLSEEAALRWCGDLTGKEVHACACVGAINCCGPKGLTHDEWIGWLRWKEVQTEMKDCPFCGEEGSVQNWHIGDPTLNDEEAYVECDNCGGRGPAFLRNDYGPAYRVGARRAWNRRVEADAYVPQSLGAND